jgi:hypothetical protein
VLNQNLVNTQNMDDFINFDYSVLDIVLPVLGLFGNLMMFIIIIKDNQLKTSTRILLFALTIADLGIVLLVQPRFAIMNLYSIDIRKSNSLFCKGQTFLSFMFTDLSAYILCLIGCERLAVVLMPTSALLYKIRRPWKICIIFNVITIFLIISKNWIPLTRVYTDKTNECGLFYVSNNVFYFTDLIIGSIMPIVTLFITNMALLWKLKNRSNASSATVSAVDIIIIRTVKQFCIISVYYLITNTMVMSFVTLCQYIYIELPFTLALDIYYGLTIKSAISQRKMSNITQY